ncbi:MAG: DUF4127 family protein [Vulcanimicrobiaceae bacterium]
MLVLTALSLITFVPMYSTPAAWQLPLMLGRIAGARIVEPPREWLGDYIAPGNIPAIANWLSRKPARDAHAFVISTDMLAYGGLDPSRIPGGVSEELAIARLQALRDVRRRQPQAWIAAFGTVMRLEPTVVEPVGAAVRYSPIAQPPTWQYIWDYAQLHDPPVPSEAQHAQRLRELIGAEILGDYLAARARDRNVDIAALQMVADGTLNRIVMGADDAGPVGLHVRDIRALQSAIKRLGIADRASVEPGADELGAALVAHALAREAHWTPRVAVHYSTPDGASTQDPLEFAPISVTIGALSRLCGAVQDDAHPDLALYVRVPHTAAAQDAALFEAMATEVFAGRSVAFVDLTYLTRSYDAQAAFARVLLQSGVAGKLDAYSSWNTDANSVGIALSEAIAAGAGRRTATYDPLAHAEFMLDRYIDDYLYHDIVRPQVNAYLAERGVARHEYLAPDVAADADRKMRESISPLARELLQELYPRYRAAQLNIRLPWPRTAEIESDIRLVPSNAAETRASARSFSKVSGFPEVSR